MSADEMISLDEARDLVCSHVRRMPIEEVSLLDSVGRVCAQDLKSDIDVSPFAHSAMDGFAVRAAQLEGASVESPVQLKVIGSIGAGDVFKGTFADDECVRIMTGAALPDGADSVVKYEIVDTISGDGKTGSIVAFSEPSELGSNVRAAGEEAKAGEVVIHEGDVIKTAGVGFLAGCGILTVPVYERPRVAIMATGSELVPPSQMPTPGHIRESNSYAMAACAQAAGAIPVLKPIVVDTFDALYEAVCSAAKEADFVVTTGGAANGDYDFIKLVVEKAGSLMMTQVDMRPGKFQTFGIVDETPVFGLPGNPGAAYCGFEMIVHPALRLMQGYAEKDHPTIIAKLACDYRKHDSRLLLLRCTISKDGDTYKVEPAKNQSSGLFGVIQRSNCMAKLPVGKREFRAGDEVECVLLDVPEEVVI